MKALRKLFGMAVLILGLGSCVIVEDEHCREGAVSCDGTVIEECIYDEWEVIEDCWWLCGGTCDFDRYNEPVCIC